ncbi:MAG: DUF1285 domain-containing protein [Alphaproteobacteria bacterium]
MSKRPVDPASLAASLTGGAGKPETSAAAKRREPVLCGDLDMRIARDGTWFYHGSPIGRKPLVKLFASVLSRDEDGDYWLTTPAEKGRIVVDDAPFVAVELTAAGSGRAQSLRFRTNLDDEVTADADHPLRVSHDAESGEPTPYVLVRDRLEALIARAVFYQLVELGVADEVDGDRLYGVWSGGCFFPLGQLDASG